MTSATPIVSDGPESGGIYKIGKPYQVEGLWYYPAEDYSYSQEGMASWYGTDFHGKRTANGDKYDMNEVTAAHPTLPMPSVVKVTNLDNGRVLKVTVNDRGPFHSSRIIDLSRRAAQLLGFYEIGTARVRVEIDAQESMNLKNIALKKIRRRCRRSPHRRAAAFRRRRSIRLWRVPSIPTARRRPPL